MINVPSVGLQTADAAAAAGAGYTTNKSLLNVDGNYYSKSKRTPRSSFTP